MMAITHAVISAAGTSLILSSASPMTLGLAILGSQLPDLDSSSSIIGQIFFPLSSWLEDNFPHRTITHSLCATGLLMAVSEAAPPATALTIGYFGFGNVWALIALPLGHLLACFSDCFTKQGVQLFYPLPVWAISVSNPYRRLRTGSTAEYSVLVVATALLFFSIHLVGDGGISQVISLNLGLRNEIVNLYNESASTHLFNAHIKGYFSSDRLKIERQYLVIANEGDEFIVTDGEGIYKTGEQIIVKKINLEKGKAVKQKIYPLEFNDEPVNPQLKQFIGEYIYLNGELTIDYPESVVIPASIINQYPYVKLEGNKIKFSYCPVQVAIKLLDEQYGIGTLSIIIKSSF